MKKQKAEENMPSQEVDNTQRVLDTITKTYGDDVLYSGSHLIENPPPILSWSPALDIALGGGVPPGIVCLCSRPKLGKTSSAISLARNAQKAGLFVLICDIEGRLAPRDLDIDGLDHSKLQIISSSATNMLSDESFLGAAREVIFSIPKSFIILDSISQLLSNARRDNNLSDKFRAPEAMVLAAFFRQITPILNKQNSYVVAITHQIANLGNSQAIWAESGGTKVQYCLSTKIKGISSEAFPKNDKPLGLKIKWQVMASPLGPPGIITESFLRFGHGLDKVLEILDLGLNVGVIQASGSWYVYDDIKAQGQEKFRTALIESGRVDELHSKIKEILL